MNLTENYEGIRSRILKAATGPEAAAKITLIAVSKLQPVEAIEELYRLGHRDFGENYVQELLEKAKKFRERGMNDIRWHFIGNLQSNKVKALIPEISVIHSVDSVKLAREIAKQAEARNLTHPLPVFISVNLHGEASKSGVSPEQLKTVISEVSGFKALQLLGLMCIPSPEEDSARSFSRLRELEKGCQPLTQGFLSMGMTQDFEEAIRQGASHIRVGTALFGNRPPRSS